MPRSNWVRSAACVLFGIVAPAAALPHGGTYSGPGSGTGPTGPMPPATPGSPSPIPTGPTPGPGVGPATGGAPDSAGDLTAWQAWWALNRDGYIDLRASIPSTEPVSGGDEFFTGRVDSERPIVARPSLAVLRGSVVPALHAILAEERAPDLVTAALLALAKVGVVTGDPERAASLAAIAARLASDNQEVSESAAVALGILGDRAALPLCAELLHDTEPGRKLVARAEVPYRTRAFAAYALGLQGAATANPDLRRYAVHHLAQALEADAGAARDVPVACVLALGLVPLDGTEPARTVQAPASSCAAQCAFLGRWLADSNRSELVRAYVPIAWARLAGAAPSLREAALAGSIDIVLNPSSHSAAVLQSAVAALGIVADADRDPLDARARALLARQVQGGDRLARRLAWIALARAGSRAGAGAEPSAASADARDFLIGELARGTTPERPWIALALGIFEAQRLRAGATASSEVRSALERALREHDGPSEAGAYCIALGLCGSPASAEMLSRTLAEARDDDVRAHAALALGLARVSAAAGPLRTIVLESRFKPTLLRDAAIGLALLGDRTLGPTLARVLGEARGLSAQAALASALGFVGDARAVDPLLAIARSRTNGDGVRAFAVVALGRIADRRERPWNFPYAADANTWVPPATLFDPQTGTGVLDIF